MARLARLYVPGMPQHVILEARTDTAFAASAGIDPLFRDDDDVRGFADALRRIVRDTGFAVHAYALLPGAVHLLGSPRDAASVAQTVQAVGRRYVAQFNRRHQRQGTLWHGRYRATVIDPDQHLLFVSQLIESLAGNPGMTAEGVRRSSYPHHVGLAIDPLITDHAQYWSLGNTPFERQRVYRELSEQAMAPAAVAAALDATRKGWIFGGAPFRERCARLANRRITPLKRGRPKAAPPQHDA
jgi:putative transposase